MEVTSGAHTDTISKVSCGTDLVLTTSWDSTAALTSYDGRSALRATLTGPLFSGCFSADQRRVFVGGTEQRIAMVDIESAKITAVGSPFTSALSEVCSNSTGGNWMLVGAAQDGHLQTIDARQPGGISYRARSKVVAADTVNTFLVLGLEDRGVEVLDLRQLSKPLFSRKLNLEHPIANVRCSPDAKTFAVSSVASRIVVEKLAAQPQPENFLFRAHRQPRDQGFEAHAIFGLAFNPKEPSILATGGTDRVVSLFYLKERKEIKTVSNLIHEVSSLDFSPSGDVLAIACSSMPYLKTPAQAKQAHPSTLVLRKLAS